MGGKSDNKKSQKINGLYDCYMLKCSAFAQ